MGLQSLYRFGDGLIKDAGGMGKISRISPLRATILYHHLKPNLMGHRRQLYATVASPHH